MGEGPYATAVAYVETRVGRGGATGGPVFPARWGVRIDRSIGTAFLRAVVSAVNRS